ncbi:FUSC family protein [Streptomyces poriferorum]|uniref:FUSC family protein n=1 Tax=Streptomyces poriferorum TaxID=2798799 RepID=A0ABY9IPJ0_9ACTN|nr:MULTISPECIES: FUSC family protein [unclassified Streptomyces]MDP5317321.1 FUSC family protein [Streptomyces sp. Alt4]WLQ55576.1 FUSC family protein [Streptomyces sp. Alt2]
MHVPAARSDRTRPRRDAPAWLTHVLRLRRAPVPRTAMVRGALGAGPLLGAGIALGQPGPGVLAALGAMLAGVNDRPGTRRKGLVHIGLPAAAGALGLLVGALVADTAGRWAAVPVLFLVGWVSGALSARGAVWSAGALQMLVATTIGMGMPLAGPAWLKALCFLSGAGWLVLLRLLPRAPRSPGATRWSGEREAVAAVFDALADALGALGGPGAPSARRALVAAQQQADEALRLMRLLPWPRRSGGAGHALVERYGSGVALCEASIALLWEGRPVPDAVAAGPRRLAAAVRSGGPAGTLPGPPPDTVERLAFDRAVLEAAVVFDRTTAGTHAPQAPGPSSRATGPRSGLRPGLFTSAGREYGLRVALCVSVTAAVALLLHEDHWYWLPATAAFLVKPDMGPLFSRVVNRFAGTVAGVLAFVALMAALGGLGAPVVVAAVAVAGALVPLSTRHFAFQTAVITVLVLSFVHTAGDTEAAASRLLETFLACVIVLLVGHLPLVADPRVRVGHRFAVTLRCTERYLRHVLDTPDPAGDVRLPGDARYARLPGDAANRQRDDALGLALRGAAYRALAEARAAAETVAAELPGPFGGRRHDWSAVTVAAELVVDAATACALRVENGVPRPSSGEAERVTTALSLLADALEDGHRTARPAPGPGPRDCRSLRDVMTQLHGIHRLTTEASAEPAAAGSAART